MIFERIKTPGIAHVAYLIGSEGEAAIVDPRRDVEEYLALARKHKLTIKYAIETHRQEDFVMGAAELRRQCDAEVINGRHPSFGHGDIRLADGELFQLAKRIELVALHTPGHTPGHTPESMCCAVCLEDSPADAWAVFTGDTLFIGGAGRTDLTDPALTSEHAGQLYDAVHSRLLPLGDQAIVLPAHGAGSVCGGNIAERDDSTLGLERRYKPLFVKSRQGFMQAKVDQRIPRPPYFRHMAAAGSGRREGAWAMAGMLAAAATSVATYPKLKKAPGAGRGGRVVLFDGSRRRDVRRSTSSSVRACTSSPAPKRPLKLCATQGRGDFRASCKVR